MIIIPIVTMPIKVNSNLGFTTFCNMIIDGRLSAVTPIINDRMVPTPTPFNNRASAIGIVPKISAYMGTPTIVAMITEKGLFVPNIF
jgi:hypothetical protein